MTVNRLLEFTRGGRAQALTGNVTLKRGMDRVQVYNPDTNGHKVILPDFSLLKEGGPHFYIVNRSSTFSLDVDSFNAEETFALASDKGVILSVFRTVGDKGWIGVIRDFLGSAIGEVS